MSDAPDHNGHAGHDHPHDHAHDHAHPDHHHDHNHAGRVPAPPAAIGVSLAVPAPSGRGWARWWIAALVVVIAGAAATFDVVRQGSALVITRFGDPVRVQVEPGPAWRLPAPIERTIEVDLRLHTTTTSGLHDVGTRDGLRVVMQAYVVWKVPEDAAHVQQFVRSLRNRPDDAADQLRNFLDSSLETVAARFDLSSLVNTDPTKVHLNELEDALQQSIAGQELENYGIQVVQIGLWHLMLPESTAGATITRMISERQTAAEEKRANGSKKASAITNAAQRDARVLRSDALTEAAKINADALSKAAAIQGRAQAADPSLYAFMRGLDALDAIVGSGTRLVLRTDAAPFRLLVEGPPGMSPAPRTLAAPPVLQGTPETHVPQQPGTSPGNASSQPLPPSGTTGGR